MPAERLVAQITYADLLTVAQLMQNFPAPWYVSGGWGIDALVGQATRAHEDLEIGIARQDQGYLHRQLVDWQLYKLVPWPDDTDADLVLWMPSEYLELPIFQTDLPDRGAPRRCAAAGVRVLLERGLGGRVAVPQGAVDPASPRRKLSADRAGHPGDRARAAVAA